MVYMADNITCITTYTHAVCTCIDYCKLINYAFATTTVQNEFINDGERERESFICNTEEINLMYFK
jgi:hypothetical protein